MDHILHSFFWLLLLLNIAFYIQFSGDNAAFSI